MLYITISLLALAAQVLAGGKNGRSFAVLRFHDTLTFGRADPIVSPGVQAGHVHMIQGGSNFALTMSDTTLLTSKCTSSLIANDHSNYWVPSLYFQHTNGSFESVPMFYMNVYYFFEGTDDKITAFPPGLRMVVGDATKRDPPATAANVIDLAGGAVPQPVQWTCPRKSYDPPSYPKGSDGRHGVGIQDGGNAGAGVGFPDANCDGYASPLRADIHFPSCYNPAAGLDNYKENMQFPTNGNCPTGWIHTPHLFYEVYWNTLLFQDQWTPGQAKQPFVLSNGDNTGYSLHGDFISGWDVNTLQTIIDGCNTGDGGMDTCPTVTGGISSGSCNMPVPVPAGVAEETIFGMMDKLPGNNPVTGWGVLGTASSASSGNSSSVDSAVISAASQAKSSSTSSAPSTKSASSAATSKINSKAVAAAVAAPSSAGVSSPAITAAPGVFAQVSAVTKATTITSYISAPGSGSDAVNGYTLVSAITEVITITSYISSGTETGTPDLDDTTETVYKTLSSVITLTRTTTRMPSATSASSVKSDSINGYNHTGCWSDSNTRVLTGIEMAPIGAGQVTTTKCVAYCESKGYSIAGTEYGTQCFCGNQLADTSKELAASKCSMTCEGDSKEKCGGDWALNIYKKVSGSASASSSAAASKKARKARHMHRHADLHQHKNI